MKRGKETYIVFITSFYFLKACKGEGSNFLESNAYVLCESIP